MAAYGMPNNACSHRSKFYKTCTMLYKSRTKTRSMEPMNARTKHVQRNNNCVLHVTLFDQIVAQYVFLKHIQNQPSKQHTQKKSQIIRITKATIPVSENPSNPWLSAGSLKCSSHIWQVFGRNVWQYCWPAFGLDASLCVVWLVCFVLCCFMFCLFVGFILLARFALLCCLCFCCVLFVVVLVLVFGQQKTGRCTSNNLFVAHFIAADRRPKTYRKHVEQAIINSRANHRWLCLH